jgi:sugar phosphate isomerase/epimerase
MTALLPRPHHPISRRHFLGQALLAAASATAAAAALPAARRSGYQIGAYTRAWGNRHYRVALDGMVLTGYKFAGLSVHDKGRVLDRDSTDEQAAAVGAELKSRGLRLVTLSPGGFDLAKPIDEGIRQLRRLVDLAVICGAPCVQVNDPAKPELDPGFYKVMAEGCDYAAAKRVLLTVHPHGSPGAHLREQIRKAGHPNLRLMYDPGNIGFYSHGKIDPVADAAAVDGVVYGMSVKDFRLPRDVSITPGTGLVDFSRLLARLRQGGFTSGPLTVECLIPGELDTVNAEARRAREFVERLIA